MEHGVDCRLQISDFGFKNKETALRQDLSTRSSTALGRELGPNGGSLEVLRSSRSGQEVRSHPKSAIRNSVVCRLSSDFLPLPYALSHPRGQDKAQYLRPGFFISLHQMEATVEKKDLTLCGKAYCLEKGQKTATFGETEVIAIMLTASQPFYEFAESGNKV
jgi:hypothetical protein